jgi:Family of unknown function (DUF6152)
MNSRIRAAGLLVLIVVALPALAHHSFSAEFDDKTTITLTGAVTKVEWFNPHIWVYLDVKDAEGRPQHWQCEGGAPNSLVRNGWTKNSLKQGDEITIDGYLAKDGSKTCNAKKVTLADGKSVFAGSSAPTAK